jgi:uncharacterized protein (TIGR03435 family)
VEKVGSALSLLRPLPLLLLPLLPVLPLLPLHAQSFAAASIKPTPPARSDVPIPEIDVQPGGRLIVENATLRDLIVRAYGVPAYRLEGGPAWMTSARFDIMATAGTAATPADVNRMLQALLVERFALRARTVTRELPIYELRMARDDRRPGPQLKAPSRDCAAVATRSPNASSPPSSAPGPCDLRSSARGGASGMVMTWARAGVPMSVFVPMLEGPSRRVVVDRTGLTGNFDIEFSWSPERVQMFRDGGEPVETVSTPVEGLSLRTALRDQLGLRLEAAQGPVDVLVIESAERPTTD